MTTAARPTYDPAKGKSESELTYLTSAKDLPSHTKLKTRKPGQGGDAEYTKEELRLQLEEAERQHFANKSKGGSTEEKSLDEKARFIEMAQQLDAESDLESQESQSDNSSDEDDDSESEDETALLMRELEKIKQERAEEKARQEKEEMEQQLMAENQGASKGNPLLNNSFSVKRRWDDDVVFRNQARGDEDKPQKRFVNDMLRSDFHRKFMRKYIH
ncbi:complexed with cef1p [Coemansia brasiliensis]|uniref:Complexed with cef1p n=1 Tax=Coemansia brasiliensis TaxID=2650707 RepID=A0A9W8I9K2_9FUNG|nr:complexed with cef1p [Coemansia brasiliensis]